MPFNIKKYKKYTDFKPKGQSSWSLNGSHLNFTWRYTYLSQEKDIQVGS